MFVPHREEPFGSGDNKIDELARAGKLSHTVVGTLLLGSLPGISIGAHLATRISDRFLFPVLASMLVLIGFRLIAS